MAFGALPAQQQSVQVLQRSLERGRLGHAYLFTGGEIEPLETVARNLAKTLNCLKPVTRNGKAVDCCDQCLSCQRIEHLNHPDVHWVRPESKTRIITVDQMRELMRQIQLKPNEAEHKVAMVVCADRLRTEAANAFLKTLEEPPARSVLVLLSTEPQRLLETILSRCLRLNFGGHAGARLSAGQHQWLQDFSNLAAADQKSLLGRYRLMDALASKLTETRAAIEKTLTARSPIQQYEDAEKDFVEKWEAELTAAIEAEYRRERSELLAVLQRWLRDIWLKATFSSEHQAKANELLNFPQLQNTEKIARRISAPEAMQNLQTLEQLQRWLYTNVQETLAIEVGLLKLRL